MELPYCLIFDMELTNHNLRHGCPDHHHECIREQCEGYSTINVELPKNQSTLTEDTCRNYSTQHLNHINRKILKDAINLK